MWQKDPDTMDVQTKVSIRQLSCSLTCTLCACSSSSLARARVNSCMSSRTPRSARDFSSSCRSCKNTIRIEGVNDEDGYDEDGDDEYI